MTPGKPVEPDPQVLVDIARQKMPFGRYAGTRLIDLPEPYLLWFADKGFPKGELGRYMALALMLKMDGTEKLLDPLRA